jgi:hypothetical protein
MDHTTLRLPVRLVPRKGGQIFPILFFGFFFLFSIFWITLTASAVVSGAPIQGDEIFQKYPYLFPLGGLPFLLVGIGGVGLAVIKLLPGAPYYHVQLAADGITICKPCKTRRFAWSEISPFAVSVRITRNKNGSTTTYWVVALPAADTARLEVESERYSRSIVQIDSGQYARGKEAAASVLSDWLSQIRAEAVEHPGRLPDIVALPPDFRGRAIEVGPAATGAPLSAPAPARRSNVIERS